MRIWLAQKWILSLKALQHILVDTKVNHKFNMMCFPTSFQTVQVALVQMNI